MAKKVVVIFVAIFISIIVGTSLLTRAKKITMPLATTSIYATWSAKLEFVNRLTDRTNTVIFGDSTAYGGINPEELNPHVYNFALDANSPLEGYYLLKYMIAQGKRPKNIVLSYLEYSYVGKGYWDYILGFNLSFISRKDAQKILDIDQNSSKTISPYGNNDLGNKQLNTVRIPYYYDIAAGPLNHIKLDFGTYIKSLEAYYRISKSDYNLRGWGWGWGGGKIQQSSTDKIHCVNKIKPPSQLTVPFYLKKLSDLANEHNINVYLLGGPRAESCINFDNSLAADIVAGIDISKLKIKGTYPITPMPDNLMANGTHVNRSGSSYFTQKIKPFFDSMQ